MSGQIRRWGFGITGLSLAMVLLLPAVGRSQAAFTEEAVARGLDFRMLPYPQAKGIMGQGVGFADLDNDGDPDAVVIGNAGGRIGIFENTGGLFIDRSPTSGIPVVDQQEGFAAADYDGDGLLDLYLTQYPGPNILMKNMGGFVFSDVTASAGVGDDANGTGPAWGDYDGDGWLDLYVSNYAAPPFVDRPNLLYRNKGDGTFEDVAGALGVDITALSFQSVWSDYDRDGDLDLYLSNDRAPLGYPTNQLWRNDGGTFVNVSVPSGAGVSLYSMGLAAGDFDGNGYIDYYVTNIDTPTYVGINPLLLNQGDGTFIESADMAGVGNYITSWGSIFFDFDNDTNQDLYVNNMFEPNSFFMNSVGFPCAEVAADLRVEGTVAADIASFSSAVADIDDDGDVDLILNNVGSRLELFINNEGSRRNHVRYNVVGEHPNLHAIGVNIQTTAGGKTQFHENYAGGNGYLGQNELVIHVGLLDAAIVDEAIVNWPSTDTTRTLTNLPVNETWTIYPPSRLCDANGDGAVDSFDFGVFAGCTGAAIRPGCEVMDVDGGSFIDGSDYAACFGDLFVDCNANGSFDWLEILHGPEIDSDSDGVIDCCLAGVSPFPNEVGNALRAVKSASNVDLSWTAPVADATHDPADAYDVYRSTSAPGSGYLWLASPVVTSHADLGAVIPDSPDRLHFYGVAARNGCGTSGEEPPL